MALSLLNSIKLSYCEGIMKTVLLVEDVESERKLMAGLLTQAGFEVAIAGTVETAWQWLASNPKPNLILLDIVMPGQSGLELCRLIRNTPELQHIPVVFCSHKDQEFDQFWALRQGGNAYIKKPFAPKQLLETAQQYAS